jgi:hypothetical protein
MFLWKYSRNYWQEELDRRLSASRGTERGGLILPATNQLDQEFLQQLTNGGMHTNKRGKIIWDKVNLSERDDYRDAVMNARIAMEIATKGKKEAIATAATRRKDLAPRL